MQLLLLLPAAAAARASSLRSARVNASVNHGSNALGLNSTFANAFSLANIYARAFMHVNCVSQLQLIAR